MSTNTKTSYLKQGKFFLKRKKVASALKKFYLGVKACPIQRASELSLLLYYMGICLKKIKLDGTAVKSWLAAQKLIKKGYAYHFIKRFVNEYGMPRQSSPLKDDWKAFYSIQLKRFLTVRSRPGESEKKMLRYVLADQFNSLKSQLGGMATMDKTRLFGELQFDFPFVLNPAVYRDKVIRYDFFKQRRVELNDRCYCGSGLSYMVCCGRTPSEIELLGGYF